MRRLRVEADKRLVKNHQLGRMNKSRDDNKLLLHSVGIGAYRFTERIGYLKHIGIFSDFLFSFSLGNLINVGNKIKIFYARKEVVYIGIIGDIRHFSFALKRFILD